MASFNNQSKNSTSFTHPTRSSNDLTWDEANVTWDEATFTWDNPRDAFLNTDKSSTSYTNGTKN
jgi:hypothetical protein